MDTEQTPAPETKSGEVTVETEPEEVTGYGYLTDAEREAAIRDHAAAVKAKAKGKQ